MSAPSPEVIIVGAGIVGICSALSLAEAGVPVMLVDRDAPGQGTSFGNAGVLSPWSVVPQSAPGIWKRIPGWILRSDGPASVAPLYGLRLLPWLARFLRAGRAEEVARISGAMHVMNRDCISLYRRHLAGTGHEDLIADSYYVHAFRDGEKARADAADYALRATYGAPIERIGQAELRALEPALSPEFQAAVLIKDQARARDPGRIGAVLADKFRSLGGQIRRARVTGLGRDGTGWQVHTDGGTLNAPKVVLSAGAWSAPMLAQLGFKVPLAAERGYHIACPTPGVTLNNSIMDMDRKFVASSMAMGLRAAGTAEFAPMDAPPTPARVRALERGLRALVPDLDPTGMTSWMGVRPSMPDSLPCIGPVPGQPGLIAAFGHSHYGLMMAPKTGVLVADLVRGVARNEDMSAFSPGRF